MQRILDIDLDFFVEDVVYWPPDDGRRPDPDEHQVWMVDDAVAFLHDRCRLEGPLPGVTVERHHEVFLAWRDLITAGQLEPPFHVTHIDAHADLGLGDAGYVHLLEDLLNRPVAERSSPEVGDMGLAEGNWLPYAVACQWLAELTFVFNDGRESDLFVFHLEDNNPDAANIQLKAVAKGEIARRGYFLDRVKPIRVEPLVPFRQVLWSDFVAEEPYDFICLCRSPAYSPATADVIYDEIRRLFVIPAA